MHFLTGPGFTSCCIPAHVSSSAHFLAVLQHRKYPSSVIRVKLCWNPSGFLVERTRFHLVRCRILDLSQIRTSHRQGELRDNCGGQRPSLYHAGSILIDLHSLSNGRLTSPSDLHCYQTVICSTSYHFTASICQTFPLGTV